MMSTTVKINAQAKDTLTAVKVFSKKPLDITISPVNVQQLNKTDLEKRNSVSVADAVKYFSGVVVKDYGGIGGLKTISVRSLGANHTAVMYDGIVMSDAQGGQIDLGRLSLDNIESIQLFNSQPVDLLLPARSYASASVLALSTSSVNNSKQTELSLKVKTGSFGFINPAVSYKGAIGDHFWQAISAEYQSAKGNYSFTNYNAGTGKSKRENADIKAYRIEYDAAYHVNDSNEIKFKLYYYHSKRGLPGAVTLFNNFSSQRLNDRNFFGQLSWQKTISAKSRILFNAKISNDYKYYVDPNYPGSVVKFENEFHQSEFYFSGAYAYKIAPTITLTYSGDYYYNKLTRTDSLAKILNFANPSRNNFLNNLSVQFKEKRFDVNASCLLTIIDEKAQNGPDGKDQQEFTPALSASVQPFLKLPFRIRVFYKRIFRVATFDDLYYTNVGNTNLRPEYADLYNLGFTYNSKAQNAAGKFIVTADFYYNKVKDKIIAVPRQNVFQWTTLNVGKVEIKGCDVATHMNIKEWKHINIAASFSYSFQDARDMTDPSQNNYKKQIPYTPKHSGSAGLSIVFNRLNINYNILLSSFRYRLGDQVPDNLIKEWATQDISLGYNYKTKHNQEYKFIAELNNVFNKQYEIIKYYPMPGINYRLGIVATFKKHS